MLHVPVVQLLHVCYAVQAALGFQQIGVFAEEAGVDYAPSKVLGFEVRVRKANKNLKQRALAEILRKMPHAVGSDDRDVVVLPWVLNAHPSDFLTNVVDELVADLQSEY